MNGSVRLSVRHTFFIMFPSSYHHEISRSYYQWQKWYHAKGQGQRSKFKVTEVKIQFSHLRTVTPVGIHILMIKWCTKLDVAYKRCPIVFQGHPPDVKITRLTKRIVNFDQNCGFPDCNSSLNSPKAPKDAQCLKQHRRGALSFFKVICQI